MKKILGGVIASLAIVGASVTPAQAATATECTTTLTGGSVGRLVVPAGATCTLDGVTVDGDIRILATGSLFTTDSTINGNVRGQGAATVELLDTDIVGTGTTGNVTLTGTTGNITIGNDGCRIDPAVGNNITLIDNHGRIAICRMTIGETLNLQDNDDRIGVSNNAIGNSLIVQRNTADGIRIRGNEVGLTGGGSINVMDNITSLGLGLTRNYSHNNINCSGNVLAPTGSGNVAENALHDQCALLG